MNNKVVLFFVSPLKKIIEYRKILIATTIQEIRKKYAGSLLGMFWIVLYPMLFLGVYSSVYAFVLKVVYEGLSTSEYICVIFSGLLVYIGFNESVMAGTLSVIANAGLIKNTMFPIELIPVRTVFFSQITQGAGTVILLVALLFMNRWSITMPFIIVVWLLEISMELGLTWILSSLNVVIRDVSTILGVIMMLLMMGSPIAYPASMVPNSIKAFMSINPIYSFIISSQKVLFFGEMPDLPSMVSMLLWGTITPLIGYHFFIKMKGVFVDNV